MARRKPNRSLIPAHSEYDTLLGGIAELLEQARRSAARAVNSILTATYWEVGRRVVEFEQGGQARAEYGEALLERLAQDLTAQHGRGFSERNLRQMRAFYLGWKIRQTASAKFEARAVVPSRSSPATATTTTDVNISLSPVQPLNPLDIAAAFPLPWSHYVCLLSVQDPHARTFYETEALRGGWSVRQLDRQISTQFYERTALSRNKAAMLSKGQKPRPEDAVRVQEEIRDPYLLEFLDLKDEYSETDLEEALIKHLEWFLLELGTGFTFVARQKRIRIGDEWYRMDLLLFHRLLRCLVIVDLKTGKFTHADAGQMNLYLNYAREHLMMPEEAEPVGIILCSDKDDAVVKYATGGINAKVFASQYLVKLPDPEALAAELEQTRKLLEDRAHGQQP
jgi:predicted nuclease of restriction endonuclease-like (RecB) superfamily